MNLQDRIERSKARADAYGNAAEYLKRRVSGNVFEFEANRFVATELMKKSRFYTDQAKQMESMG